MMGIYCIEDAKSRLYYGSSEDIETRWYAHIKGLNANRHINKKLQRAWNKYGEGFFSFYVVEVVIDNSKLLEREQHWLDFVFATEEWCYNICRVAGSTRGYRHTEETKQRLSQISKNMSLETRMKIGEKSKKRVTSEETRKKLSEASKRQKRKPLSEETKQKISISVKESVTPEIIERIRNANIGKKHTTEQKRKVAASVAKARGFIPVEIEHTDGTVVLVESVRQFCRDFGIAARSEIRRLVNGERKEYRGWCVKKPKTAEA